MWTKNDILTADKLNQLEDNVVLFNSNYSKTTWQDNDIIEADNLNNIEQSINQINNEYTPHTWVDDEEITAEKLNNINTSIITIGTVIYKDGIPSVCVYDAGGQQEWGRYLFVDRDHDLCYYIFGKDYVDQSELSFLSTPFPEWGGEGIKTAVVSINIGDGLNNTNSLIDLNLSSYRSNWPTVWNWVEEFRTNHSNNWFVPSGNELLEVYKQRSLLFNLSLTTYPNYWSSSDSSEVNSQNAYHVSFTNGDLNYELKRNLITRVRLCFYL